jgi:hypothetical protein
VKVLFCFYLIGRNSKKRKSIWRPFLTSLATVKRFFSLFHSSSFDFSQINQNSKMFFY